MTQRRRYENLMTKKLKNTKYDLARVGQSQRTRPQEGYLRLQDGSELDPRVWWLANRDRTREYSIRRMEKGCGQEEIKLLVQATISCWNR